MALITIDPEFEALIPKLSPDEYAQLERNILREGCLDNVRTWGSILIDGHNRYRICKQHNIPFGVTPIDIVSDNREGALLWIEQNQLGRRNLTDDQRAIVAGRLANRRAIISKKNKAKDAVNTREKKRNGISVNDALTEIKEPKDRAEKVAAKEAKVSVRKVRAAQTLEKTDKGKALAAKVLNGEMPLAKAVREAAPEVPPRKGKLERLSLYLGSIASAMVLIEESSDLFSAQDTAQLLETAKKLRCGLDGLISQLERERKTKLEDAVVIGGVI